MRLFLVILIVVFSFSQKAFAGDMQGFMNALEKAKNAGLTIDADTTAKQFGYKNFDKFLTHYKSEYAIDDLTVDEAKEFLLGSDNTVEIVESQENLNKLYDLVMSNKYFVKYQKKRNSYLNSFKKGKYKKNYLDKMALAVYINYEKEMSKISKDPNLKEITQFEWGWGYASGSSSPQGGAIKDCITEAKKIKLSGGECVIIDFRSKNPDKIENYLKPKLQNTTTVSLIKKLKFKESGPFYGIKKKGLMNRGVYKLPKNENAQTDYYGLFTKNEMLWKGYSHHRYKDGRVAYQYNEYKLDKDGKVLKDENGIFELVDSYLITVEDFEKVKEYIVLDMDLPFSFYDFDIKESKIKIAKKETAKKNKNVSSEEIIDFKICKNIRDKTFANEMFDFYNYKIDLKNNTVLLDYAYTDKYIEIKKNKGEKPLIKKQSLSYIILKNKDDILITDLSKHTFKEVSDKLTINLQTNTVKVDAYLRKSPILSVVQSCQRNIDIAKKIKLKISTNEKYYALVIGNNNYKYLEKLDAAENDAKVIADVLTNKYGFEVDLLLNADYDTTVNSLFKITNKLKRNDNLLIYYAGHGELDKAENRGYWLPVDASYELRSKWISNQRIVDRIKATKAKHVLLIADSCFSGTLMRSGTNPDVNEAMDEKYIERLKSKKTRLVITSGGNEPVVDSDGGDHSLFALKLIDTLKNNNTVINSQMLFENIRRYVVSNTDQTPERALVHKTGHDGGDFLFFPKE